MCAMFLIAIVGMIVYRLADVLGLSRIDPYGFIVSSIYGLVLGALLNGLLYSSRYIVKLKKARDCFLKSPRE